MSKIKQLVGLSSLLALSMTSAIAADSNYQSELGLHINQISVDGGGDVDTTAAEFTYHFDMVDTSKGPLAEASFLDHSSNIALGYATIDVDGGGDADITSLSGELYHESGFYFSAAYLDSDGDNAYSVEAGYMVSDNWLVALGYTDADDSDSVTHVRVKGVTDLGEDQFLNFEAVYADQDNNEMLTTAVDFYFNRNFSLGVSKDLYLDGSNVLENTTTYTAKYFVTPAASLYADYTTEDGYDAYTIGASFRF